MKNKYFLSFPRRLSSESERALKWQGQVLGSPQEGYWLVQLYGWFSGDPTDQVLVSLNRMIDEEWFFYDDVEDWREGATRNRSKETTN